MTLVNVETLEPLHRDVLCVLALSAAPPTRARWREQWWNASLLARSQGSMSDAAFKEIVVALHGLGAIVAHTNHTYEIEGEWLAPVLDTAARTGRLQILAASMDNNRRWGQGLAPSERWKGLALAAKMRVALATADLVAVREAGSRFASTSPWATQDITDALGLFPPRAWLEQLDQGNRLEYLRSACHTAFTTARKIGDDVLLVASSSGDSALVARVATIHALRGDPEKVQLGEGEDVWRTAASGFVALTLGDWPKARADFAAALKISRAQLPSYLSVFGWLAIVTDDTSDIASLSQRVEKARYELREWPVAMQGIKALTQLRITGRAELTDVWETDSWIDILVGEMMPHMRPFTGARRWIAIAEHAGYVWLARQLKDVLDNRSTRTSLRALQNQRHPWEHALDALAVVAGEAQKKAPTIQEGAIAWTLDISRWGFRATARLVTRRAPRGKTISLDKLRTDESLPLEPRDRKVVMALTAAKYERNGPPLALLLLLEGHPRLRDTDERPIAIVTRDASLKMEPTSSGARLVLDPPSFEESGVAVRREGDVLLVTKRTPLASRMLGILGPDGLAIPREGLDRMGAIVAALSSELPVQTAASTDELAGDARIRVQLFRVGATLRARLRVKPGGDAGAALRAGVPPQRIAVVLDSQLRAVRRDLDLESAAAFELLERCPVFASLPMDGDDHVSPDLGVSFDLLVELKDSGAIVEWPDGDRLLAPTPIDGKRVRVAVRGTTAWLEIDGELRIDEHRVVSMRELLTALSSARGSFVPIGPNEYLSLTEDLRAKLEALAQVEQLASHGRISTGVLPALETILEGLDASYGKEIEAKRKALARAEHYAPKLPRSFRGELRDYQRDGFLFLARRAEAGTGACLADDMGLGKTVQALALLAHRAARGPALVVCPMSVCRNWEEEAARFTPTLRIRRLHEGDRRETVDEAGPRDVIITSYGLLVTEAAALAGRKWSTVIFDEAHALKNAATLRWAAARALSSDAVVALTGTPLENHAGELHAIFDVLTPGLLGSRASFDRAFGNALAEGRPDAASTLRQIVRPLLMRRTKAQVLSELPPKTEMTRIIEPSADHRAFYEALRRRALDRLSAPRGSSVNAGQARFEILAEITRLRRAAIDPRLVGGDDAPPGTKMEALARLVADLREEGHRALVFSQYLEVLDMAKAKLDAMGVRSLRLDGTMTGEARATAVAAFQSGQADVFLLSLKAGGVGMNLTAADYVIHLDPWWNPAVEDQASDRAHRIGQTRPVTIVRLVTEGTIEEKVLALHATKRKLYEDVVSAADGAGTLDVELLVGLLGDTNREVTQRGAYLKTPTPARASDRAR